MTARAATPLAALDAALAAHAQRLAFEPPDFGTLLGVHGEQTIGGVLAANLAGSRRVAAGAARDHFLGFSAVSGRGERFKAGGKVVKNVTGYDLPKLLAGSWGTLAVLTDVTLRVTPAAELDRTLVMASATPAAGVAILTAALGSPHDVSAAGFDPARGSLLRIEGFAPSVAARADALCAELRATPVEVVDGPASRQLWHAHASAVALATSPVVWRISVPPTRCACRARATSSASLPARLGRRTDLGRVRRARCGARARRFRRRPCHVDQGVGRRAGRDCGVPAAAAGRRGGGARLKAAFDPRGVLNPGRMG